MKEGAINIGLIGLGTVGSGTFELLQRNSDLIRRRAGCGINIRRIAVRQKDKPRSVDVAPDLLTEDAWEIVNDPAVEIVVEVMGGVEPARALLLSAIEQGKSVVTANKELLAKHGAQLMDAAREKRVDVNFEGSVAGGIPLITPLKQSLAANRIERVTGILNGTTNYILTRMAREGLDFDEALREAQQKGFAESDPSSDVDGHDAAYKLAIVSAIAFGSRIPVEEIFREGISRIRIQDIRYAAELGYVIKLLAIAQSESEGFELRVHPTLLPVEHPLASVSDEFNAIMVEGDGVGRVMFYGKGAGAGPTGSAVVADIIDTARNILHGATGRIPCTCDQSLPLRRYEDVKSMFYFRMLVADRPGVLARIAGILGEEGVSIASMIQKGEQGRLAEVVWITHRARQKAVDRSIQRIQETDIVPQITNVIHVTE